MENTKSKKRKIKVLNNKYEVVKVKELRRFEYLGMTLLAHKSINFKKGVAVSESQTGALIHEIKGKDINECFNKLKEISEAKGLNIEIVTETINTQLNKHKKLGISTPLNQ